MNIYDKNYLMGVIVELESAQTVDENLKGTRNLAVDKESQ